MFETQRANQIASSKSEPVLVRHAQNSKSETGVPPLVHEVLNSLGQPLERNTRAFMESRFGEDLTSVPVGRTVGRVLQTKLAINKPGDEYEQEADRIAEHVMQMPEPQRHNEGQVRATGQPERLQTRSINSSNTSQTEAPPIVGEVLASPGQTLPVSTRDFMESRFGHDFSSVRVHTDSKAAESARAVNANAYAVGQNIVFGAGQFAPKGLEGRRLLAHELTHVAQQHGGVWSVSGSVQREPKLESKNTSAEKKIVQKNTVSTAPKLDLMPSKNGSPCACLMVVHNDERNARKTAELMHTNCSYNLALISPDTGRREIKIPGHKGTSDPNSFFPHDIAQRCVNDRQGCRDFLTSKAATTDKDEIDQFVQIQFFLTVSDCSNEFSLPVVTLHNNDIEDTKNYLKNKDKAGVGDLKLDVDKSKPETGDDQIAKLKDLIKKKFGNSVETEMMETAGKTNIFRWCASKDLSQCHIGDPDHPDNVTWVTNEKDFAALSKNNINVAFQSQLPSKKSESEGDLSTLFLLLKEIFQRHDVQFVITLINNLSWEFGVIGPVMAWSKILMIVAILEERIAKLRYINIESPGKRLSDQTDSERIHNYEAIVEVLKTANLHCCGDDASKAEGSIKTGLKEK